MKILLVHRHLATFVKIDLEILQSEHEVHELHIVKKHFLGLVTDMVRVIRYIFWADVVFSWFGGYHALLPFIIGRLLRRKCVVVASGYDVAALPETDYGNMRSGIRRLVGLAVFHLSHLVLPVSQFTAQEVVRNTKTTQEKIKAIYHGLESPLQWNGYDIVKERQGVITISNIKYDKLLRKGLLNFVKVASLLPDVSFTLIGPWLDDAIDDLKSIASPNIEFMGPCYGSSLGERLLFAKVYVQISAYESFGMAVAEAMLMGCIPVVTNRGALPEVVGDNGFCVPYDDVPATADAIRRALVLGPEARTRCRQQITENFPLDKRRKRLLQVIRELYS